MPNYSDSMPPKSSPQSRFANLNRVGVFTYRLRGNRHIQTYIPRGKIILNPHLRRSKALDAVFGWGMKRKSIQAKKFGALNDIPYFSLEDGFIHSMGQGQLGDQSWSLVADSTGIFYDASQPSDLELLILNTTLLPKQREQCKKNIQTIIKHGITKYNNSKRSLPNLVSGLNNIILVIDQVEGDLSIEYSLATKNSFQTMLDAAISENPNSNIFIKTHPDVINAKKKGCIDLRANLPQNVKIISENTNSLLLASLAKKVYVVSSQVGFDALLLMKKVICFGAPFYAGWGLTEDRLDSRLDIFRRRHKTIDIETIFYAAYDLYSSYIHPDTDRPCSLKEILDYLVLQLKTIDKYSGNLYCIGFTPWKKRFISEYLGNPESSIFFPKNASDAEAMGFNSKSTSCLWSFKHEAEALKLHSKYDTPIWKIEDGFIRSLSLGSNYSPPSSLVIDKNGLYLDPSKTSDLETILSEHPLGQRIQQEAATLRQQLISQEISKYQVGKRNIGKIVTDDTFKRLILIPGQVSDDKSVQKGCIDIRTNLDLIKEVRAKNLDAFIIYKPHPDVLSGNRVGHITPETILQHCDLILEDICITECLHQVDEVHTMTSLVGFEGLIRGLKVHCYGVPFYSGWGLTIDRHACERRNRKLSLDELIAGVLLLYPTYYNWNTKAFTTPHVLANQIHQKLLQSQEKDQFISILPTKWRTFKRNISLLKAIIKPS